MILSLVVKINNAPDSQTADHDALRLFYVGVGSLVVGLVPLIGSVVCGLCVVKSRRHVLWWIIPAALVVALFVDFLEKNAWQIF